MKRNYSQLLALPDADGHVVVAEFIREDQVGIAVVVGSAAEFEKGFFGLVNQLPSEDYPQDPRSERIIKENLL